MARDDAGRMRRIGRRLKEDVISAYGGCCACCGTDEYEFLCIDHVGGGGLRHLRELFGKTRVGLSFYRWLRDNGWPVGFRVLCHNCNFSIGAYGYCPHDPTKRLLARALGRANTRAKRGTRSGNAKKKSRANPRRDGPDTRHP